MYTYQRKYWIYALLILVRGIDSSSCPIDTSWFYDYTDFERQMSGVLILEASMPRLKSYFSPAVATAGTIVLSYIFFYYKLFLYSFYHTLYYFKRGVSIPF